MAPVRYSLHYEDYSEQLMARFGKLLQLQSLVDMTLMCSSHTLRVHKAVLAASSTYFQEVLQKQTGEPLIILKMRFSVLKSLVEFMYCGRTNCLEENLDELVSAAQFLKIKGLSKVTKEGLGITNHDELPVFSPPVVINRPPASAAGLTEMLTQDSTEPKQSTSQMSNIPCSAASSDNAPRSGKDMVVRIPFDIRTGAGAGAGGGTGPGAAAQGSGEMMNYVEPLRASKPRRGRPSVRRGVRAGEPSWERQGVLARAAERALMRREQDSRNAIHQLKHLQTIQMQDYMDRVTLSQAVDSICGTEGNPSVQNYMNMDSDLMYMDQNMTKNNYGLDQAIVYKDSAANETITSDFMPNETPTTTQGDHDTSGISSAMSQYVNALKNAGLPTDLPILFESGDGSYINVNEQVLLDMVQSSEIQYEVIDQPNIIENVVDPGEIKSIDDLSKSIERGEMLLNTKSFASTSNFGKDSAVNFDRPDDTLNTILPDIQESYTDQQSYAVMEQVNNALDHENPPDFTCMDGDMQFFTNKAMNDDVKKYYEEQQLDDPRVMGQICPTTLDTSFNMSLLEINKVDDLGSANIDSPYHHLNTNSIDLRKTDCFDFELQLPQNTDFKGDSLHCLMANPTQPINEGCKSTGAGENVQIILPDNNVNNVEDLATKTDDERYRDMINTVKSTDLNTPEPVRPTEITNFKTEKDESGCNFRIRPLNVAVVFEADTGNVKEIRPVKVGQIQTNFLATTENEVIAAMPNIDTSIEEPVSEVVQLTSVDAPLISAEVPLESGNAPLALEEGSLTLKEGPLALEERPLALEEGPSALEERPLALEEGPSALEERPLALEEGPSAMEEGSLASIETPLTTVSAETLQTRVVNSPLSSVNTPQINDDAFTLEAETTDETAKILIENVDNPAHGSAKEPDIHKNIDESSKAAEVAMGTFGNVLDGNIGDVHFDDVSNDDGKDVSFVNIVKEMTAEFNDSGVADCSMTTTEPETKKENLEASGMGEGTMCNNIPFAVGLLPLREIQNLQSPDQNNSDRLKRKASLGEVDSMDNVDAKCLKRKVKYKKL